MGEVIGDVLPVALGVAVSPIPIISVILMLLAPRAGGTGTGFLLGWLSGIVGATALFWFLSGATDLGSGDGPSPAASTLKLLLGALLLLLAVRNWRSRPAPGETAALPKWMTAIDSFGFGKAAGLGFLLSAVNPKNLTLCVAAGSAIGGLGFGGGVTVLAVYAVVAASTVAIPVLGYTVAPRRMAAPLDRLKTWLQANNATVMAVLLAVIGVMLFGKGLGGLL